MVAFTFRMPSGIAGTVSRIEAATIEAGVVNTTNVPTVFGDPLAYATAGNGGYRPIIAGDTTTSVKGFLVRPFPTQGNDPWPSNPLANPPQGVPYASGILNVLKRGYIQVTVAGATLAVAGGPVYCRTVAGTYSRIGAIEAAADGSNTFIIPHCEFVGPQDAQGNGEIRVYIGPQ